MCAHSDSRVQRGGRDAHSSWKFPLGTDASVACYIDPSLVCYILLAEAVRVSSLGDDEKWAEFIAKGGDRGGGYHNQVSCQLQGAEGGSSFAAHLLLVMFMCSLLPILMVTFPTDSLAFVFQLKT